MKRMKRLFSILLCLVLLAQVMPMAAFAGGAYQVYGSGNNVTFIGDVAAFTGQDYTAKLKAQENYVLPESVLVSIGGLTVEVGEDYSYDRYDGTLTIFGSAITGQISIFVQGVVPVCTCNTATQVHAADCDMYKPIASEENAPEGSAVLFTAGSRKRSIPLQGDGSASNPYLIYTSDDLHEFAWYVNNNGSSGSVNNRQSTAYAKLMQDISYDYDEDNDSTTDKWYALGSKNYPYAGVFDGNGKTISGLWLDDANGFNSFIRVLGTGGEVRNLTINGSFTGGSNTGGIVGRNSGTLSGCTFAGSVTAFNTDTAVVNIGGLVGDNQGTVTGCHNSGTVSGSTNIGGIVGINKAGGSVTKCSSSGTVSGAEYIGGIAGTNEASIRNCYNIGGVSVTQNLAGGVVGVNSGILDASFGFCTVIGHSNGGIVGKSTGTVSYCAANVDKCSSPSISTDSGQKINTGKHSSVAFTDGTVLNILNHTGNENVWMAGTSYPVFNTGGNVPAPPVAVTGVTLSPDTLTLKVGDTETLTATVAPADADNQGVTWTSSDTSVAKVDKSGNVTAVAAGTATITVTTADGGFTDTCVVAVHTHNWTYTADGAVITATCANEDGKCPDPTGGTLTLSAEGGTYNANDHTASYAYSENWVPEKTNPTITYAYKAAEADAYAATENLKNAGFYKASVTLGDATAAVEYTVAKKSITIDSIELKTKIYDGTTAAELDVIDTSGIFSRDKVLVMCTAAFNSPNVLEATKVIFSNWEITGPDAGNYELKDPPTEMAATIQPKSLNHGDISVALTDNLIFEGAPIPLAVKDGDKLLTLDQDYTIAHSGSDGQFTITVTGKGNYKDTVDEAFSYIVVQLPDPASVTPNNAEAIAAYEKYLELNKTYQDAELAEKLEELKAALTAYAITGQTAKSYTKTSGKTITFTANGYIDRFAGIAVDGEVVDARCYRAVSDANGNTVITLRSGYLGSLSLGKHAIKVLYELGGTTYSTDPVKFRVTSVGTNPITGDSGNMMLFAALIVVSMLGMAAMVMFLPRKKGKYQH